MGDSRAFKALLFVLFFFVLVVAIVSVSAVGYSQERLLESIEERIVSSRADIEFMRLNGMQGTERYNTELEILVNNYELRDRLGGCD